jgi:hypothetical protein
VDDQRGRRDGHGRAQTSFEPLAVRSGAALVTLGAYDDPIAVDLVPRASAEVLSRRDELCARGVRWGYLLGVERAETAARFAAAWQLWDRLGRAIAADVGAAHAVELQPSFCKAYHGPVVHDAEGVHYEGLHRELLRILINVGASARRFRFGDVTRDELSRAGLHVPRDEFRAAEVERHVPMREVLIPGCSGTRISFLVFWASVVPHVGVTEAPGYFLYSFEGLALPPPAGASG